MLMAVYGVYAYAGVWTALEMREAIDAAMIGEKSGIFFHGAVLIFLVALQTALGVATRRLTFRVSTRLENKITKELFEQMLKKEYGQVSRYHTGELMNLLTGDVSVITSAVATILPHIVYVAVKLAGVFIVLSSVDPLFAVFFAAAGLLVWAVSAAFKGRLKNLHKRVQASNGKVRSFLQEILGNMLVIKAFAAEEKAADNAQELLRENYKIKSKRTNVTAFTSAGMNIVFTGGYVYGIIWGALKIADKAISYGTLTEVLSLISQLRAPVSELSSVVPQYYSAVASAERIIQLEEIAEEKAVNCNFGAQSAYEQMDCIEFRDVCFAYDNQQVFQNASLTLKKGEFAVISGISGIGKSTLIKMLMGVFAPQSGEIFLRLKSGEKIAIDKNVRPMFAYVPQGNFLISGTIRRNICFANENASQSEISEALRIACCDFTEELPDGLETRIGENGLGLSQGQVQRLAVARALLGKAPILLLDEATSALDEQTEIRMLTNLRSLKDRTCVLITHKNAAFEVCGAKIEIVDNKIIRTEV